MAPSRRGKVAPSSSSSTSTTQQTSTRAAPAVHESSLRRTTRHQPPKQQSLLPLKSALTARNNGRGNHGTITGAFGRVTKSQSRSSQLGLKVKFSDVQKGAFEKWSEDGDNEATQDVCVDVTELEVVEDEKKLLAESRHETDDLVTVPNAPKLVAKRKRGDLDESATDSDIDLNDGHSSDQALEQNKKRRVYAHKQLLSPPASTDGDDRGEGAFLQGKFPSAPRTCRQNATASLSVELPTSLLDLISMHAAFLRTLSLHYAHNGASTPVELGALMEGMTRIWRKRNVQRDALQRMLGLYELAADSTLLGTRQAEQKQCRFTITTSGLGTNIRTNLEYVGQSPYTESSLQATYSDMVHRCFRNNAAVQDVAAIPLLTITLGMQTSVHRAKAAATRAEILGLSASAKSRSTPDFSKLSISDPSDHTPTAVKSRTLSLFDRVRAKGLAAATNATPTSEQIIRRHAIGRISEVVEFLRMKQQQRLSMQFDSSVHGSPGKVRGSGKVSFSLPAIVKDIRQSVAVPIGEEEVRTCLRILSHEIPGDWCRMIEIGSLFSVTLQGMGMSGVEVKRILDHRRA